MNEYSSTASDDSSDVSSHAANYYQKDWNPVYSDPSEQYSQHYTPEKNLVVDSIINSASQHSGNNYSG